MSKNGVEDIFSQAFPHVVNTYQLYAALPASELIAALSGMLDVALAELLSKQLLGSDHEIADVRNDQADQDSPAATFGSRIQLARLGDLVSDREVAVLRALKNLRNVLADHDELNFVSPEVQPALRAMYSAWLRLQESETPLKVGSSRALRQIEPELERDSKAGACLTTAIFSAFQDHFQRKLQLASGEDKL